jgi:hypothetical protein
MLGVMKGMIPLYSLTSELIPISEGDEPFKADVEQLAEFVGDLLDQGGIATEELILKVGHFVEKLQVLGAHYDKGEAHAWESISVEVIEPVVEARDDPAPVGNDEKDASQDLNAISCGHKFRGNRSRIGCLA